MIRNYGRQDMVIKIENKSKDGFDVHVYGARPVDDGVMSHVIERMDNYYDAEGLLDIDWRFYTKDSEEISAVIEVIWNEEYDLPEDRDVIQNVKRWLGEVL
jgi:hypothetical protein